MLLPQRRSTKSRYPKHHTTQGECLNGLSIFTSKSSLVSRMVVCEVVLLWQSRLLLLLTSIVNASTQRRQSPRTIYSHTYKLLPQSWSTKSCYPRHHTTQRKCVNALSIFTSKTPLVSSVAAYCSMWSVWSPIFTIQREDKGNNSIVCNVQWSWLYNY